jgi:transcriptional regulator with XRE-family HTH domain
MDKREALKRQALAAFLKEQRAERGWSQRELARRMGVTHATLQSWESAKSTADTKNVEKIADVFGIESWELMKFLGEEVIDRSSNLRQVLDIIEVIPNEDALKILEAVTNRVINDAAKRTKRNPMAV